VEQEAGMDQVQAHSTAGEISRRAVQLLREFTGRGPTKARTVVDHTSVMVLLEDTLTKGEQHLAASGKADIVLRARREFQWVMRDELVKVVEEETGRKVIAFMSDNHIDPDMAAEIFVLEPTGDGDRLNGYPG
jgi:uncharacterized protein YbcI